ncbi:hypothetical protein [Nesterenkonia sp.]|uniref:hypothetical protein n=1 Tax=Nesterenkonia sp. TaxID=704201 RepID=UPI0026062280|nr:hypothetical protein [Nesterenkonia sp.]
MHRDVFEHDGACHDLGTQVIAPDVGCYASQGADHLYTWSGEQVDAVSLRQAARQAAAARPERGLDCEAERAAQRIQWRRQQRRRIAADHEQIYRRLLG